jgi:hypothetical protein
MQRCISVTHKVLAKQVNAVIEVLLLDFHGIGIVVIVGVVSLADEVDTMEVVEDVEDDEKAALVVTEGYGGDVCLFEVFLLYAQVVVCILGTLVLAL